MRHAIRNLALAAVLLVLAQGVFVSAQGTVIFHDAFIVKPPTAPSAPLIENISPGNAQLEVSFKASFNGGSAITNYEYSVNNGDTWTALDPASTASPLVITGLTNGTTYQVKIRAVNAQGPGAPSEMVTGTPATVPSAPTITSITAEDTELRVNFTAGNTGGSVITTYEYSIDNGSSWTARSVGTTESPLVITELTNGTPYQVKIRAVNAQGSGAPSEMVTGTPMTVPAAPTNLSVSSPDSGQLSVSFTAPINDGGSPITNYQYSLDNGANWTARDPASTASPLVITGLTNGTVYTVQIRAVNEVGLGAASVAVSAAPGALRILGRVTSGGSTADDGLANIDVQLDGANDFSQTTTTASEPAADLGRFIFSAVAPAVYTVTAARSFDEPISAEVTVSADGGPDFTVDLVFPPPVPPDAPTITGITASDAQLSVAFNPPNNEGKAPITEYEYSTDNGTSWRPVDPPVTNSPLVLTEPSDDGNPLVNGTEYQIRIRAVNAGGAGTQSNMVTGTPVTVPAAPTIDSIATGETELRVNFTAGSTGGSVITTYEYSIDNGSSWTARAAGTTESPLVIIGLINGTEYQVRVRAVNAQGPSAPSGMVPGRPVLPCAEGGICAVGDTGPGGGIVFYVQPDGGTFTATDTDCGTSCRYLEAFPTDSADVYLWKTDNSDTPGTSTAFGSGYTNTYTAMAGANHPVAEAARNASSAGKTDWFLPSKDELNELCKYARNQATGDTSVACADTGTVRDGFMTGPNGDYWSSSQASPDSAWLLFNDGSWFPINKFGAFNDRAIRVVRAFTLTHAKPTITNVTPGDGTLSVTFTPGDAGASTISGYEYSTDDGATWRTRAAGTTDSPLVITTISGAANTALVNGTTYPLRIRAVTAEGPRAPSDVLAGKPETVPSAPTITGITAGDTELTVNFTADSDGGSAITTYEYSTDNGDSWTARVTGTTESPLVITGLTNGTPYQVKIRAVNTLGPGVASNMLPGTPATVPSAPTITDMIERDRQLSVAFTAAGDGGSVITTYEYSTDGGDTWTARATGTTGSPLVITGLTNGTAYQVLIRAVNAQGSGAASEMVVGTPATCANGGLCVVGDTGPGGGVVFYVAPDRGTFTAEGAACNEDCRYLEAWTADESGTFQWKTTNSATGTLRPIGTGFQNTYSTMAGAEYPAAEAARNASHGGKSDWFLPSRDELNQLWIRRSIVGRLNSDTYWSSTDGNNNAYYQFFRSGNLSGEQSFVVKTTSLSIRLVRAF